jgi:hypothetical protein
MKFDVLTIATLIFTLGVLVSSIGFEDVFASDNSQAPTALQQGIPLR